MPLKFKAIAFAEFKFWVVTWVVRPVVKRWSNYFLAMEHASMREAVRSIPESKNPA